jgi:pyrimidine-nucleoside phosphorylase/thymidine phosphorylase
MHVLDLIIKKRDGQCLSPEEIAFTVDGYTWGSIPDYQMASFLMAVFFQGLNFAETVALTRSYINTGDVIDLSSFPGIKVDKHSTGGVGDKTTLVLVPLVASAGVTVVKMSGRALGFTGGTLDKLESIPGFRVNLTLAELKSVALRTGAVLAGQTGDLTPADKKIYALRDVTGTVECLPLIAASVMSKKIAGGADRIVLDVKVGAGGFMTDLPRARELAEMMVALGWEFGRSAVAVLSSMQQPLGLAIGNALEVREALLTLSGRGPADLTELCLRLGAQMLIAGGVVADAASGYDLLAGKLQQGAGLVKLREIIAAQGGLAPVVDHPDLLPLAATLVVVRSAGSGYIQAIKANQLGWASLLLGAGRMQKEDQVDPAVGITLNKKLGDRVAAGEALAVLHVNRKNNLQEAEQRTAAAFTIGETPPEIPPLIYEIIA